jgi:uncharacterized protein involved in outer membrane biogenesis
MVPVPTASTPWIRKLGRYALYLAVALVLLAVALHFAVPAVLRHVLETNVSAQLQRKVAVTRIEFNPLTLSARIEGLTIQAKQAGAPPLLALDGMTVDVSLASIWHRAPVFDRVLVEHPHIALARNDDGSYSVQDLVDAAMVDNGGPPARFSLNNIEVQGGTIDFDDHPRQRKHEVRDLSIGIPFLSSLPYQTTIKVLPHVAARVNGSPFSLAGTTTPFARERDASLDIDIDKLSLAQYLAYLPVKLRAKVTAGTVSTRAKLVFSEGDPQSRALWISGEFTLDDFVLQRPNGAETLALASAKAHVARLDIFHQTLVVDNLRVERPVLTVRRAGDGAIDLAAPWIDAPAKTARAADTSPPWQVGIEKASIADGTIHVDDSSVKPAYRVAFSGVTLDATDLSTAESKRAHLRVAMNSEFGATAKADVDMIPATLDATGHVEIDKLSLRRFYPYYANVLNLDVQSGSLSIAGDFAHTSGPKGVVFTVQAGEASLDDLKLALRGERAPLWRVPRVALTGVGVDVAARRIDIAKVTSRDGALDIRRDREGAVNFARLLKATVDTGRAARAEGGDEAGWSVVARQATFDRYSINVDDRMPASPVALKLRGVDVTAENLSNARGKRGRVTMRAATADGGKIALDGPLVANPLAARMRVDVSGLALAPLQPYLDPYVNVTVTAGKLAANGRLQFGVADDAQAAGDARTRWNGDVTISDFAALDTPAQAPLARWKRLALTGVDASADPPRLAIGTITLQDYFARVIVHEDATLNFVRLLKPQDDAGAATPASPADAAGSAPVSVGKVVLADGNVRYTDLYIRPNYTANLSDVAGTVSAMSATQAGNVDISAKVERTAPVEIKGTVNPFARDITLDLAGKARDVDLPPLSPYAAKYAGYGITRGKLSFDVHYRIKDRKLVADNKLVLDQLTFGERVDSPTATKLPVQLAVALLKDANGVIDIEVPISGSLDDPQFSVGGLIVKVIVNLLQKAVTAPFALLGAAFGGGGEEMSYVAFDPGRGVPVAAADAKLDTLGKALTARPSLKVDIAGHSDTAADTEALRRGAVERAIRAEKLKALAAAGTPPGGGRVEVSADERLRYLTAAYKDAPIKERPRNFFGILKDVPAADMEAMLYAHATAGDDALRELAQRRAQAVKEALVKRGVAPERLFIVTATAKSAKDAPAARVDLALK